MEWVYFGLAIKEFREKLGKSQAWLGKNSGVGGRATLCKIEAGARKVTILESVKIAKTLRVPLSKIVARAVELKDA